MKRIYQIPTCKFCGQEVDWGHICEKCRRDKKKNVNKELISNLEEYNKSALVSVQYTVKRLLINQTKILKLLKK